MPSSEQIIATFLQRVGTGATDDVRALLLAVPALVNAVGPHPFWGGRPQALHVAIEGGRRDIFDILLEHGADLDGKNDQYDLWSPLMLAIDRKRAEMREELIRRGARLGLLEALMLADDEKTGALLTAGGLPAMAPNGGSILAFARTTTAIDRLIGLGAKTDVQDRWGATPIAAMSRLGAHGRPLVAHLVAHGVPAGPEEYARLGDAAALEPMVAIDPGIAKRDAVMMAAVDFRHHALVLWLLDHGGTANARATARAKHTALHSAAWNGDLEMARLLVAAGADPAARDEEHLGTPLGWAETSREVNNNATCVAVGDYLRTLT